MVAAQEWAWMNVFRFPARVTTVVCLGAHPDDIEIGAGATIASLAQTNPAATFHFIILGADARRRSEAEESARRLLGDRATVSIGDFRDSFAPYENPAGAKRFVKDALPSDTPDLVFAPQLGDLHQDHRYLAEIAGQVCRDSVILGYEIAKYDGGLEPPTLFVHINREGALSKVSHLKEVFQSQNHHHWFTEDAFLGLMRLRGLESNAPDGYAEGFISPKMVLA